MAKARSSRVPVIIKQEADDDSDTDEPNLLLKKLDSHEPQIIHSGHFMVSSPHSEHPPKKGYDFDTVNKQTCQTYSFGKTSTCHLSIDASLTKLFECMTLAYSGKLVSPKWKNFKGLKLLWRDKIRLNNAIWRAWYMQYLEKRKNPICHFVTPLEGTVEVDEHRRPEAITTEGKYWKRRIEVVIREYHKWRTYFKKRLQKHKDEDLSSLAQDHDPSISWSDQEGKEKPIPMEQDPLFDVDMLMSEFSDTLFSTLSSHQAVAWPNPREIAHAGNADMIQPGLIPLQPNLDFMDTFDAFQDLFSSSRSQLCSSLFTSAFGSVTSIPTSNPPSQAPSQSSCPVSPVNLDEELIPSPGPTPSVTSVPVHSRENNSSIIVFDQTPEYNSQTPLTSQQTFLPLFPISVPPVETAAAPQHQTTHPTVPQNTAQSNQAIFASPEAPKFGLSGSSHYSVITHTASATLTHNASATTFSQSQNLILTTQHQGVPCNVPMQTTAVQQPPRTSLTFALPKAVPPASSGTRIKQLQKIVPAPKPEAVPIMIKNTFIAPVPFRGQPSAVIVTPASLKGEGVMAAKISQPSVVIAPATVQRAGSLAEFQSRILVGPVQQAQNALPAQPSVSHRFTSNTVPTIMPKGEPIVSQSCSKRVSSPTSKTDRERRSSGQASPCGSEQSPSPQSPQNNCSGKTKAEPQLKCCSLESRHMVESSAPMKKRFQVRGRKFSIGTLSCTVSAANVLELISNAATLQKTVEYIAKLQQDRTQMQEEVKRLREEVEELNAAINSCQQQLPATGVPITRQRFDHMREMFDDYAKTRTLQNWKFWIFSIIIKPLFESFNGMVSTTSLDDLCQTTLSWLDRHCSLLALRPMVLNTLRQLSTTTSILSDPSLMPEQAMQAVGKINKSVDPP
uniref:MLX interacting protein n=1 Tax=Latimeria chalumnae TaxID=7897 RepID=H3BFX7_LATCH